MFSTRLSVPFIKTLRPDLLWHGWPSTLPHMALFAFVPFVLWVVLVLVGSTNAVNLTDGLDGLAIGCTIIAAGALAVLTYITGHVVFADYLELQRMPMIGELTVFCGSMVGASIGFLWYNAHPAEIFMGDVGSLALGGAIGTVAIIIRQELLLPFIGGIFVLEAMSVVLCRWAVTSCAMESVSSKWRHCTTTSSNWVGASRRSLPASGSAPWCLHCLHSPHSNCVKRTAPRAPARCKNK